MKATTHAHVRTDLEMTCVCIKKKHFVFNCKYSGNVPRLYKLLKYRCSFKPTYTHITANN